MRTAASPSIPTTRAVGVASSPLATSTATSSSITVAWAEGIQAAIYAFKEITSPYWLNEKRLRDHKIALIGEKIAEAASQKSVR